MSVRRCPSCKNYVDVETGECPVCGRGYLRAMLARAARWAIIVSILAAAAVHHFRR